MITKKLLSGFYIIMGILFVAFMGYWGYLQFLPVKDAFLNYAVNIIIAGFYILGALLSFFYSNKSTDIKIKKLFMCFGGGLLVYALGNSVWTYYNLILKESIPYPSLADIFYMFYPIFIGCGYWILFDYFKFKPSKTNTKLSLIIVFLIYIIIFVMLIKPEVNNTITLTTLALNMLYPLTDALLISLAVVSFTSLGEMGYGTISLSLGMISLAIGDILFTYRQSNLTYWNGDISDLFFFLGAFFIAVGIYRLYSGITERNKV